MAEKMKPLSEAVYRAIVEGSPIAKILVNREGVIVLINAQVEAMFGYERKDLIGKPVETLVPLAIRGKHPQLRNSYFEAPRPRYMGVGRDLTGTRKDGSEFPVEIALNPIKSADGEFVLAAVNDITERKRAEDKFRSVVEASPTAMIMIDEAGNVVLANAQVERLFGYQREELMTMKVEVLVPDPLREGHPNLRDGFFSDPRPRTMGAGRELHGKRKDGSLVPVEIGLNPIQTEDGKFAIAAIADITERRRADEKFRAVVESAPNAMVMIDVSGTIVLINNQAEKLFGYSRAELLGKPIEALVPQRIRDRHPAMREGFFADPRPRMMGMGRDLTGARKDGSEFPVEIGLNPIETSEGRFAIAAIADISERVDRENLLARQRDEILELSTPVMQVWDKVLALPIIGTLDSQRATRLTENLLQKIAEDEAEFVILDISGVPTIDSQVAQNLLKTVQGARLMGADCILSGVRPETAQTMVHLGIDIGALRSRSTMRDALQLALTLRKDPDAEVKRGLV